MIVDNLLDEHHFYFIKHVFHPENISWNFCINSAGNVNVEELEYPHSFYHTIYHSIKNIHDEKLYSATMPILLIGLGKNNQTLRELLRIRIGMILKAPNVVEHGQHIDYNDPHRTALFYLTTTGGPTIMYDENNNVVDKVYPLENRWFDFDGLSYHSSSTPTKEMYRLVINFNYTVNEDH